MARVQQVGLEEMLQGYDGALASLEEFGRHRADAHLLGEDARCSLWWGEVPQLPNEKVGLIGHFEARTDQSAAAVLDLACAQLKEQGCTMAIGPMDGSTWNRYRLVTEVGEEPQFFLEPWNPVQYPGYFTAAGFATLATYCSALNSKLVVEDPLNEQIRRRISKADFSIRNIDADDFDGELKRIYEISVVAFRRNFLYTPISEGEFLGQYAKIRAILRPELVLIAVQENRPVGFMFGVPDLLAGKRGGAPTVLLKTLAVLPERSHAGLGGLLISECQQAARRLGFTRSIFALMHDSNASRSISSRYGTIVRRYALYSKSL